jgi:release factor glutamine methyltransferase
VGPGVLVPRPETELLVENALRLLREAGLDDAPLRVAEVGVGSGAIAVTLALEAPNLLLTATDISERALDIARANALRHGVGERIGFHRASFLDGLDGPFDAVVSNPPYVAERDRALLPPDVRDHEPGEALFAGEDGLDAIRALIPTAAEKLRPGGFLLMEIGDGQAEAVCGLVDGTRVFDAPERLRDYRGVERMILARRKV